VIFATIYVICALMF